MCHEYRGTEVSIDCGELDDHSVRLGCDDRAEHLVGLRADARGARDAAVHFRSVVTEGLPHRQVREITACEFAEGLPHIRKVFRICATPFASHFRLSADAEGLPHRRAPPTSIGLPNEATLRRG